MVLWRELAHLHRWDNLINLIQRIVESLLFFHPAVWWASKWVRLEREYCCDLIVVQRTGRPRAYVETLAALAAGTPPRTARTGMAQSQVVLRIRHILEFHEHHMTMKLSRSWLWGCGGVDSGSNFPCRCLGMHYRPTCRRRPRITRYAGSSPATRNPIAQFPAGSAPSQRIRQGRRCEGVRPNEPKWKSGPVPQSVPIRVEGRPPMS